MMLHSVLTLTRECFIDLHKKKGTEKRIRSILQTTHRCVFAYLAGAFVPHIFSTLTPTNGTLENEKMSNGGATILSEADETIRQLL